MAQLYVLVRGCVLYNSTVYVLEIHPLKKNTTVIRRLFLTECAFCTYLIVDSM